MEAIRDHMQDISVASLFNQNPVVIEQRIARRKPMSQEKNGNIVFDLGVSMASLFSNLDDIQNLNNQSFKAFIANRMDYIEGLKYLGKNWISGQSFPPNETSIAIGKEILEYLEQWYINETMFLNVSIPSVIMGPIPSGGLSIEISPQQDRKLYINIYNNGKIEIELDNQGYFSEMESTEENYKSKIAEFLSESGVWDGHSGWGNFIPIC